MRPRPGFLLVLYWLAQSAFAQTNEDCAMLPRATNAGTVVAWNSPGPVLTRFGPDGPWQTKFGRLRAIAIVRDREILEPRNAVLGAGESLWNVLNPDQQLVLNDIYPVYYLYRQGVGWCLFSAEIDETQARTNALFASDPRFRLRPPTDAERAMFEANIYPQSYCANRAGLSSRDALPEEVAPCDEPALIGLSDVNENGRAEFWATEILRYSTGIAVWEHDGRRYIKIFSACPLCGD